MIAATEIEQLSPTIGENKDWLIDYNSLPAGNKKLIEFIVARKIIREDPIIRDEEGYENHQRKTYMSYAPADLRVVALKEEGEYTKKREYKLAQIETQYLETSEEFRCLNPHDDLEKFLKKHDLNMEEFLKKHDSKEESEGSWFKKKNKKWDELTPDEKHKKVDLAIVDKYIDKYVDFMCSDEDRGKAVGIRPYKGEEKNAYKVEIMKGYSIGEFKSRAKRTIVDDHSYIVAAINNAFQPKRENQLGYRSR